MTRATGESRRLTCGVERPRAVRIDVDGQEVEAFPGESVATALLGCGTRVFRRTSTGAPRGPLCNMGVCFDCLVTVDGLGQVRACMTAVEDGMSVRTRVGDEAR
jgi:D-hydroxyproline dehydrogenase subunit gamma